MFGFSSFNSAPQTPENKFFSQVTEKEILDTLGELIPAERLLNEQDIEAIKTRSKVLTEQFPSLAEEDVIRFAYIDRTANTALAEGVDIHAIVFQPELAAVFIKDPKLATDEEFVATVVNKAIDSYQKKEFTAYTDALNNAAKIRVAEIGGAKDIDGTIDKDGVVTVH